MLTDDVLHPCRTKKCEEDPFSLGECRALIEQHCAKYPEDRECELHGLGDGCFFLPGSSPCLSVDCQQSGFLSDACQEVVRGYCTYGSTPDPECLVYGYGNSLLRDLVESFTCPWDSVEASCEASNVAFDFCAMIKGGKIARHASPASLKFDPSIQESLLELHAAAVKKKCVKPEPEPSHRSPLKRNSFRRSSPARAHVVLSCTCNRFQLDGWCKHSLAAGLRLKLIHFPLQHQDLQLSRFCWRAQ